jgi:hypothetical protein
MVIVSNHKCIMSIAGVDVHPGSTAILPVVSEKLKNDPAFKEQLESRQMEIIDQDAKDSNVKVTGNNSVDEANAIMLSKDGAAIKCISSLFDKKVLDIIIEKETRSAVKNAAVKQLEKAVK